MRIRNKVVATFFLEEGCEQDAGETSVSWKPVNFDIYSDLFPEMIKEATDEWIADNTIAENMVYEIIFAHEMEHDGGGAILGETFLPIYQELQPL